MILDDFFLLWCVCTNTPSLILACLSSCYSAHLVHIPLKMISIISAISANGVLYWRSLKQCFRGTCCHHFQGRSDENWDVEWLYGKGKGVALSRTIGNKWQGRPCLCEQGILKRVKCWWKNESGGWTCLVLQESFFLFLQDMNERLPWLTQGKCLLYLPALDLKRVFPFPCSPLALTSLSLPNPSHSLILTGQSFCSVSPIPNLILAPPSTTDPTMKIASNF